MKLGTSTCLYLAAFFSGLAVTADRAMAQWMADGNPVCSVSGNQRDPAIVPDGTGGAIVVWIDSRDLNRDLYAQRITSDGDVFPGWPAGGVYLAPQVGELWIPVGVPDGTGGAILVWEDETDFNSTGTNVRAQRVTGGGVVASGWPADGLLIGAAPDEQRKPRLIPDGSGGALIVWQDERDDPDTTSIPIPDIYAVRITADGAVAPGWLSGGTPIAVVPGEQLWPWIASDGAGGAYICWTDGRDLAETGGDIYLQRMTGTGEVYPGWPENGEPVCTVVGHQVLPIAVEDGLGGVFLVWKDSRALPGSGAGDGYEDHYAIRILGDGSIAAGWPADGLPVCLAPETQQNMVAAPDGLGGVVMAWEDYRSYVTGTGTAADIYAQRVSADGTIPLGWPSDGVALTQALVFSSHRP